MRVLLITKSLFRGGAARGANNLADSLSRVGVDVIKISADSIDSPLYIRLLRVTERVLEKFLFGDECHCLKLGPASINLSKEIEKYRPDLVQLCDVSGNVVSFKEIRHLRVPVVHRLSDFWPYGGPYHYRSQVEIGSLKDRIAGYFQRVLVNPSLLTPDLIVGPSEWILSSLSAYRIGAETMVIRNALPEIPSLVSPRPHVLKTGSITFGFVSGKVEDYRKGFDLLSRFLNFISKLDRDIVVNVHGRSTGSDFMDCDDGVTLNYLGEFKPQDAASIYSEIDILLCPSRADNSPNVVCEAMAYGVPVIGQSNTGISSYIEPAVNGHLIDFQSTTEDSLAVFANVVEEIVENYTKFSCEALAFCERNLLPESIGREYLNAYMDLIDNFQSKTIDSEIFR